MVTIWPSFISCLMTSDALTDILCARSATLIVSGMCTSCAWNSAGATNELGAPSLRSPRRPARGARQPARPAPGAPRGAALRARFLAASSAQLELSFSDLIDFLSPGLATVPGAAAPGAPAFLWIVPLMASLPASAGLAGSSGFFATSTFFGAFIIVRIAAASSSAALRRLARSAARCFSSFSIVPALTTRSAGFDRLGGGRLGFRGLGLGRPWLRPAWARSAGPARGGGGGFGGGLGGGFLGAQLGGLALGALLRLAAALLLLQLFFLHAQALGLGVGLFLAAAQLGLVRLGRGRRPRPGRRPRRA